MAKNSSLLKFEGTLDGMTFYKNANGHFVKTKGGISKKRILNDSNFVRTRENMNEFSSVAQSGKVLRHSLGTLINRAKDSHLTGRLTGILSLVKNMDSTSIRGLRVVSNGIVSADAKSLLRGFDFNAKAKLHQILKIPYQLDTLTGQISIADFIPAEYLSIPEGATHVSFRSGMALVDFETGISNLKISPVSNLLINMNQSDVILTPDAIPSGTGTTFYLLMIEFFQEVNGVQYSLRNGAYNALNLVELI
jgi:hypothetical protein